MLLLLLLLLNVEPGLSCNGDSKGEGEGERGPLGECRGGWSSRNDDAGDAVSFVTGPKKFGFVCFLASCCLPKTVTPGPGLAADAIDVRAVVPLTVVNADTPDVIETVVDADALEATLSPLP